MAESESLAHSPTLASQPGAGGERLERGAKVGEYVVERFLGAGAMGEVYAGAHPVIGKKVAIKVLKAEVAASPDGAARFKREAQAVNQVDHPNVIDTFAFGRLDDGRLYLVMDLVDGKSLRRALVDGPLEVDRALYVLGEIADALDAAHARGVVHRDLKPDNVMLGTQTPPKVFVLDFGLAKLVSATEGGAQVSMLTGKGTWLGTPGYMAPEQWSADGAGPASDRYSLGVMAFELLSGSLPFDAPSLPQMMEQHFRAKVPALSARGAMPASSAFDPIVKRALAKDPDARFATAREMVDALRAAAGAPGRGTGGGRRAWVPAVAGAGVLGLSVAAVLVARGGGGHGDASAARTSAPAATPRASGLVRLEIHSVPRGAEVVRDGRSIGATPTRLDVAPGTVVTYVVRRPGFTSADLRLTAPATDTTLPVTMLAPVRGFEGVWALPNGELRAFERVDDDRVAVSKLRSADGEREFFRHYAFTMADHGVAFAATEKTIDDRAPNEPSCHIPLRAEYRYDPASDRLSVRRETVVHDLINGHCVIKSAVFGAPLELGRADRHSSTERATLPPVGLPVKDKRPPVIKSDADELDQKKKALLQKEAVKQAPPNKKPQPVKKAKQAPVKQAPVQSRNSLGNDLDQAPNLPRQAPAPQAVTPPANDDGGAQAQRVKPNPPTKVGAPPRGDAQIAPPIQQQQRRQ